MSCIKAKGFVLRHIRLSDLQRYFECYWGKHIKQLLLKVPKDLKEAKKDLKVRISDLKKKKPFGETFAIEVNGDFAGYVDLHHLNLEHQGHKGEIGYAIHPSFRRKGLASKAVKVLTEYAFRRYKLKRISAMGRVRNKASAKVLEKAGYKLEGILKKINVLMGFILTILFMLRLDSGNGNLC